MKTEEPREVAFFGRITAGFTHEMKNVLAIIKESTGLMEDLLSISKGDSFPHKDRFVRVLSSLQGQVRRGVDLSNRLNRFAHSSDEPLARIDLNDMVEQMVALSERFARLKEIALKARRREQPAIMVTSPVKIQLALFLGMECCWSCMGPGGEVSLAVVGEGDAPTVSISCRGPENPAEFVLGLRQAQGWNGFAQAVEDLGGEIHPDERSCGLIIAFGVRG